MDSYDVGKKFIVESDHLDFIDRLEDFDQLCQQIVDNLPQRDLFLESRAQPGLVLEGRQPGRGAELA